MTCKKRRYEMDDIEWSCTQGTGCKDPLQSAVNAFGISHVCVQEKNQEEVCDDPSNDPLCHQKSGEFSEAKKPVNRKKVSAAARMKLISLKCEWNRCEAVYKKIEKFISHVADHLAAETGPPSGDGYLCYWRECWFACGTKEELDRHVYFHAFHAKTKSIGAILMEERQEQCILDSSGRNMIPEIPEAFQCMWDSCVLRFASAQDFYWHVQGHAKCTDAPESKGTYDCAWEGCTAAFKRNVRLRDHVRSHTQEKIVGCPNCGGIYSSNTKFYDHCTRQIPLDLLGTVLYDYVFVCKSVLHLSFYLILWYILHYDICLFFSFAAITDLTRHLSVHSEEPAYVCPFHDCEFKCRAVSTLNRHIKRIHNGLRKYHYACHMCNAKFSIGDGLTKHLIKVHSFVWPVGHTRFRYKQDEDGFYRLQTVRYESIELTQEIGEDEENLQEEEVDSPPSSPSFSSIPVNSKAGPLTPRNGKQNYVCQDNWADQEPHRLLNLKHPTNVKISEHQEIILPSEF
ncbi:histone H4 transcription factor-like [Panulirus ornatus]|uniref:histone H4 transcription factor-like n=1 Tax=Panulirus ornatus TaxID=150431 RepID=UPI003A8ADDB7